MTITATADLAKRTLGRADTNRYPVNTQAGKAIYALKPVSFRYHKQYDATQTIAFGLIGEEVAEVNSDLLGTQSRLTAQICSLRTNQRDDSQMSSSKNTAQAKSRIAKSRSRRRRLQNQDLKFGIWLQY